MGKNLKKRDKLVKWVKGQKEGKDVEAREP